MISRFLGVRFCYSEHCVSYVYNCDVLNRQTGVQSDQNQSLENSKRSEVLYLFPFFQTKTITSSNLNYQFVSAFNSINTGLIRCVRCAYRFDGINVYSIIKRNLSQTWAVPKLRNFIMWGRKYHFLQFLFSYIGEGRAQSLIFHKLFLNFFPVLLTVIN